MATQILHFLCLGLILTAGPAFGKAGSRADVRQAAGYLEAQTTNVRLFVRENAGSRGADLEGFREKMLTEKIPTLRRELNNLQQTVQALTDGIESTLGEGVEIVVESCWNKWKKILAADKYIFRAVVTLAPGMQISKMGVRDPKNQDIDPVRIPAANQRSDGQPGEEYVIGDSFKTWSSKAELVVEDQNGREHTRAFSCRER
jgi:hypothetical protein